MNKKYWLLKIILGGFETSICFYGDEVSLRDYIQKNFNGQMSYVDISDDAAESLMRLSCKIYMCPTINVESDTGDQNKDE